MSRTTAVSDEQILEFIFAYATNNGYGPSLREICKGVGWATVSAAQSRVHALKNKGLLTCDDHTSRSTRLTVEGMQLIGVDPSKMPCPEIHVGEHDVPQMILVRAGDKSYFYKLGGTVDSLTEAIDSLSEIADKLSDGFARMMQIEDLL